jgi:hypothetical protein
MNIPGTAAAVTGTHKNELMLFFTLLELTLIILAGRIGGALAKRGGQSAAVGEIIIGIALGPSLFGLLAPRAFDYVFHSAPPEPLTILSNLGLVLLMFQIGLEFDFAHLTERVNRAAVLRVSIACLALPFACGLILGLYVAENASPAARINTALFVATAFSITAVPVLGRIMMELNLTRTRLGVIAISSAAVNDVVGWLLLALVTTLTVSDFVAGRFALRVAMVAAFGCVSMMVVRPLLKKADEHARLDGAHRHQRRARSRRDIAEGIHDVGHHGDCQHRDHHARAALLHASGRPRAVRHRRRGRRWRYGAANSRLIAPPRRRNCGSPRASSRRAAAARSAPDRSAAKYRRSPGRTLERPTFRAVSANSTPTRRASRRCGW